MKKGFTLIEILAVIVILAIIALIAVPIVIHIINDSKKESLQRSIDLYMDAVKETIINHQMIKKNFNPSECEIAAKKIICDEEELEIEVKGKIPSQGLIIINNNKITYKGVVLEGMEYAMHENGEKTSKVYVPPILASTTQSYVGYYADVDGNGTVDGIIFADLLIGSMKETQKWGNTEYSFPTNVTRENVKKYYVSQETYIDNFFCSNQIIVSKNSKGLDRFYVMQLTNFKTDAYTDPKDSNNNYPAYTSYYWYYGAYDHMKPIITENGFGTGKENTRKMIDKWNSYGTSEGYEDSPKNNQDIWKHIQEKFKKGWFLPSREEWAAFSNEVGRDNPITTENYNKKYGLSWEYMTSSQYTDDGIWRIYFNNCNMYYASVKGILSVRLSITF